MKIDRNQVIAVILILVVIHNSYLHYTHPAYRFYEKNVTQFRSDYNEFRRQIIREFIPAITNISDKISAARSQLVVTNSVPSSFVSFPDKKPDQPIEITGNYFQVGSEHGFTFEGFSYFVGDNFRGGEVLLISPSFIQTTTAGYILRRQNMKGASYAPPNSL